MGVVEELPGWKIVVYTVCGEEGAMASAIN